MGDLRELYQEVILDHSKNPRNFHVLPNANHQAEGFNPLCGDRMTLYIQMQGEQIKDIAFQGSGCAISKSSASVMTATLKGKTLQEAEDLFNQFHLLVAGKAADTFDGKNLGKLAIFSGVREFPARVKCATLAWHTLRAALKGDERTISTEKIPTEWEAG